MYCVSEILCEEVRAVSECSAGRYVPSGGGQCAAKQEASRAKRGFTRRVRKAHPSPSHATNH